jgi:hypothetical protein
MPSPGAQEERDRVMTALFELMLTELFELRMVQTDPNFANYQYRWSTGEIVLLDFGATREFKARFTSNYRKLAVAAMQGDRDAMAAAAEKVGYSMGDEDSRYRELVLELLLLALEPLRFDEPYDFACLDDAARACRARQEAPRSTRTSGTRRRRTSCTSIASLAACSCWPRACRPGSTPTP